MLHLRGHAVGVSLQRLSRRARDAPSSELRVESWEAGQGALQGAPGPSVFAGAAAGAPLSPGDPQHEERGGARQAGPTEQQSAPLRDRPAILGVGQAAGVGSTHSATAAT